MEKQPLFVFWNFSLTVTCHVPSAPIVVVWFSPSRTWKTASLPAYTAPLWSESNTLNLMVYVCSHELTFRSSSSSHRPFATPFGVAPGGGAVTLTAGSVGTTSVAGARVAGDAD